MKYLLPTLVILGAGVDVADPEPPPLPFLSTEFDHVIQRRFGTLTDADLRDGRFGISRIEEPAHKRLFRPRDGEEQVAFENLYRAGWDMAVFIQPLDGALLGPIRTRQDAAGGGPERGFLSVLGKRAIVQREPVQALLGTVRVEARPIPVPDSSCLGCHPGTARVGDPLGAAVYVLDARK